ncbi:GNAT family N-acetyltransferase [Caenimonas koreensis]|uniref:GNAT family N-acetyltransferase n=1 Tax=Caenimonas koreensis TaxID=367474 RepID=UPI0037841F04
MPQPEFIAADLGMHRSELIELNVEYLSWVFVEIEKFFGVTSEQIIGMSASEYVPTVIDKVCGNAPPKGVFYLVTVGGTLAGMGGMRSLGGGIAEVKRIYIRPAFRGMNLGDLMLKRLLADAKAFGHEMARLDTGPFMQAAHRVYESNGFVDRPPYEDAETPAEFHSRWRFMERQL